MLAEKEGEILTILRSDPLAPGTPYCDTGIIYIGVFYIEWVADFSSIGGSIGAVV